MSLKWNIALLVLIFVANSEKLPRTQVGFYCRDPKISHPFTGDTVPNKTFLIGSIVCPLIILSLVEILNFQQGLGIWINLQKLKRNVTLWYNKCFTHILIIQVITDVIKLMSNEHRPHFLDVCQPDLNESCLEGSFVENYKCTSSKYSVFFIRDCSKSFPSGHSAVSVFVALYCINIIATKLTVNRLNYILRALLILVCLTWGLVCSISRFTDKRHHWWDVLFGVALGVCGAAWSILHLRRIELETQKKN